MKVVVPVKAAAALDDEFELRDGSGVDPADLEYALNEWDDYSLEAALQLREQAGAGEVVVVTVGDGESEPILLACLAKGADRALRISDERIDRADPLTVARVLAAALEPEQPHLILCGVQSSDAANAATGVALAAYLDLPWVAVVRELEHDPASGLTVERELEGGVVELLRVRTPALLTIQTGINQPRYANLRAIKQAKDKPLDVHDLARLGLSEGTIEAAAGGWSRGLGTPAAGQRGEMLVGTASEVAERIVRIVRERLAG